MSKHTLGPWKITKGASNELIEQQDGPLICFAASNNPDTRANARLIAAAPDLLEALLAITSGPQRISDELHSKALVAILKATSQ